MTDTTPSPNDRFLRIEGRRREREILRQRLIASRTGPGSVVLVSGEAGIGKTTLVEEAIAEARAGRAVVLTGSCYDLTTTPPFGPWLDIARRYRPDGNLPAFPEHLAPSDEVVQFLEQIARARPLVIVLEDMHWADHESVDLLRVVARHAATLPLALIVTYRDDDLGRESPLYRLLPLLVREAHAERIDLRPFDASEVQSFVGSYYALYGDALDRLAVYLLRRAEGNPFYTLELLRDLEENGLLAHTGDGWRVGDIESQQVPTLLRQVIDARLARIDEEDRQRLAVAAVIGQDVPIGPWAAVLDVTEADLLPTVERASAARLIDAGQSGETIRFRHALLRDALYQSMLPPRRRVLHARIGDMLAAAGNADPDVVAWHFQASGDARAIEWLIRAGERAERSYAWTTAAGRFVAAAELLAEGGATSERGWLLYRIGRLRRHADPPGACRWLEAAGRVGEETGDDVLAGYARFDHGHVLVLAGNVEQGLEKMLAGDQLLDGLHLPPDGRVAAWISDSPRAGAALAAASGSDLRRGTLVQWLVEAGRYREGAQLGEPLVASLRPDDALSEQVISSLGDAWFGLGRIHGAMGEPERARQALGKALECYQRIGHRLLAAITVWIDLCDTVMPYEMTNRDLRERLTRQSSEMFQEAAGALPPRFPARFPGIEEVVLTGGWSEAWPLLETLARPGLAIVTWRYYAMNWLARLSRERGDPGGAWNRISVMLPDGPATVPGTTSFARAVDAFSLAVELCLDDADTEKARVWADTYAAWLEWNGAVRWRADLGLRRAQVQLAEGDPHAARRTATGALAQARETGQLREAVSVLRFLGDLDTAERRFADAESHLVESQALAEACGLAYERALSTLSLAGLRVTTGATEDAGRLMAETHAVFEQLDARPALERLNTLAERVKSGGAPAHPFGLSNREVEVLRLVAEGLTDAEVADRLFISYRTVTTHLSSIFSKLGVSSRVSATRIAVEHGIV